MRCGYPLVGFTPADGRRPCPECGLLSGLSFLDARELKNNRPRWLRVLAWGAAVTLAGLLALPVSGLGLILFACWTQASYQPGVAAPVPLNGTAVEAAAIAGMIALGPLLVVTGAWLLTWPAGRTRQDKRGRRLRWSLRLTSMLPLVGVAVTALMVNTTWSGYFLPLTEGVCYLLVAAQGALPILLFHYLKDMARRAPLPLLAADSPVVGWASGLSLGLPLVVYLISVVAEAFDIDLGQKIVAEALRIGVFVVVIVGLTTCFWSLYLLVRYVLAFRTAAQQAREIWRAGDLANDVPD